MAVHAQASAAVAEDRVDAVAAGVGAGVLAAVWGAEFSFLLRSGERVGRDWIVDGERADFFVGGVRTTCHPDVVHRRSRGSVADGSACDWRDGIYVRSGIAAVHPAAQLV